MNQPPKTRKIIKKLVFVPALITWASLMSLVGLVCWMFVDLDSFNKFMDHIFDRKQVLGMFYAGEAHYQNGDYDKASELFHYFLHDGRFGDDNSSKAYYYEASSIILADGIDSFEQGRFDKKRYRNEHAHCKEMLRMGIHRNRNRRSHFYYESILLHAQINRWYGQHDSFIAGKLNDMVKENLADPGLLGQAKTLLGYQYLFAKKFDEAKNHFDSVQTPLSSLGRIEVLVRSQERQKAIAAYREFLAQTPSTNLYYEVARSAFSNTLADPRSR